MKTHVSYGGCLQKVQAVYKPDAADLPKNKQFIACGRLVNPAGSYLDAPQVKLYWVQSHNSRNTHIAVL